jgi:hypothetical protein
MAALINRRISFFFLKIDFSLNHFYSDNQHKPPTLTGLPRFRNNSVKPAKLPPLHNPPRVFLPYHQRKQRVLKKVRWNEKELSKAEDHVEVKHSARGEQGTEIRT